MSCMTANVQATQAWSGPDKRQAQGLCNPHKQASWSFCHWIPHVVSRVEDMNPIYGC